MRTRITMLCIIVFVMLLCGCGRDEQEQVKDVEIKKGLQIGMSFDSFIIERWTRDKEIFVATAAQLGAEVNVQNANGDLNTQIEQIRYLISKEMDVIVIIAVDSGGLADVVKEARNANIRVIAYDRLINNADLDLYISFDNKRVGSLMASALMDASGETGKYMILSGPTTDNNVKMIEEGFLETVKDTDVEIAASMNADSWKAEYVYDFLEENEDMIEDISGIMCGNDNLATQTIRFLAEKGYAGKIPVVGQDAELEACQRIVEGTQLMTVYKPVEELAANAAECAVKLAKGEDILARCNSRKIENGNYACPYINLTPVAVNEKNMDDVIIKDGFHLREEVYLNIKSKM